MWFLVLLAIVVVWVLACSRVGRWILAALATAFVALVVYAYSLPVPPYVAPTPAPVTAVPATPAPVRPYGAVDDGSYGATPTAPASESECVYVGAETAHLLVEGGGATKWAGFVCADDVLR